ncbi:DUF2752 domain-containing protein [Nocardioides pakistanensis]
MTSTPASTLDTTRRGMIRCAAPGVALAGVTALVLRDPHGSGSWGTCPSLLLFGVYCPGCGSLRGLHDLATGQLLESVSHNLILVPALAYVAWWWLAQVTTESRRPVAAPWDSARFSYALLAVLAVFTVARNLPGSVLAP